MKVLFVCTNNVTRSQMAEAFFGRWSSHQVTSAGVRVSEHGWDGWRMQEITNNPSGPQYIQFTLDTMSEEGFDLSGNVAKQLTPDMVVEADRIVVLCPQENVPDYVLLSGKVAFERIRVPSPVSYESFAQLKNEVKKLIEKLVKDIG